MKCNIREFICATLDAHLTNPAATARVQRILERRSGYWSFL